MNEILELQICMALSRSISTRSQQRCSNLMQFVRNTGALCESVFTRAGIRRAITPMLMINDCQWRPHACLLLVPVI